MPLQTRKISQKLSFPAERLASDLHEEGAGARRDAHQHLPHDRERRRRDKSEHAATFEKPYTNTLRLIAIYPFLR